MKKAVKAFAILSAVGLSACGSVETATRNAPLETPLGKAEVQAPVTRDLTIVSYNVEVPRSLRVSEANLYYPMGDIVWREDPRGDRHAQVAAILEKSVKDSARLMGEGTPVAVNIRLDRFHALTEKARYTVGGVHNVIFHMSATDARTGEVIVPEHKVDASLTAYGGSKAVAAEQQGLTQKFRISNHLTKVIYNDLTGRQAPTTQDATVARAAMSPATASGTIKQF